MKWADFSEQGTLATLHCAFSMRNCVINECGRLIDIIYKKIMV
jgi:hypothetical protein